MTPEQKHQWINDWVRKWSKAERDLAYASDSLRKEMIDKNFRCFYADDPLRLAFDSAKEAYVTEGKKIEAKLIAELREIESMIEVKHD